MQTYQMEFDLESVSINIGLTLTPLWVLIFWYFSPNFFRPKILLSMQMWSGCSCIWLQSYQQFLILFSPSLSPLSFGICVIFLWFFEPRILLSKHWFWFEFDHGILYNEFDFTSNCSFYFFSHYHLLVLIFP
jgi:hypothetical protein